MTCVSLKCSSAVERMSDKLKKVRRVTIAADNPAFIIDAEEQQGTVNQSNGIATIGDNVVRKGSAPAVIDQAYIDSRLHKLKINIWKKLILTSVGVLGVMSMYDMLRFLESSLNSASGLGTTALATNYATMIPSLLFAPALVIKKLGLKTTLIFSFLLFNAYFAAHFYPTFYTLIPSAVVTGFGCGLMEITANCIVTELAITYASATRSRISLIINRFFGLFVMTTYTGKIWGNLVSSFLLDTNGNERPIPTKQLELCGSSYCQEPLGDSALYNGNCSNITNINCELQNYTEYTNNLNPVGPRAFIMYGICSCLSLSMALLIIVGFDKRPVKPRRDSVINQPVLSHLLATFKLLQDPSMLLLIPLTITLGLSDSFTSGDFTKAFITCTLGMQEIGITMVCYGVAASLMSCIAGIISNHIGRPTMLILATCIDLTSYSLLLLWRPQPSELLYFYLLSGASGTSDGIWKTQIYAFYGEIFRKKSEAGFANLEIWQASGFVIGYAWHGQLCMEAKIYAIMCIILIGMVGYGLVELRVRKESKKQNNEIETTRI